MIETASETLGSYSVSSWLIACKDFFALITIKTSDFYTV